MSVTAPAGFQAAGVSAGLRTGRPDVAVVVNTGPKPVAAAVFTANRFPAAPVTWSRAALREPGSTPRAVVLNSGGANACTGPRGDADAATTAQVAAEALGFEPKEVLVCSTGLIGELLPMDKLTQGVRDGIGQLAGGPTAGSAAAHAIMTTDTKPKEGEIQGEGYKLGGMAKGAGMLAPELATMLVVLTTDAVLEPDQAQAALRKACDVTFNVLDSDGCMSTNDTVILLASGASGQRPDPAQFERDLRYLCVHLSVQLLADAEGADHDIAIKVEQAFSRDGALAVARAIARSNLFKAAIFGRDPNWGRILAAAGTVGADVAPFDPADVALAINGIWVVQNGAPTPDRERVTLDGRRVEIDLQLGAGEASATVYTSDLTYAYVHENSEYAT
jgi:glutamate N-acetyltransferase/amino-acid N-acetyltransferase